MDASLQRLGIDTIDIYMTHWQSVEPCFTPIAETVATLNALKKEGKIRAIGAANVDAGHIREYLKHGELDIVQAKYSILDRALEAELLPLCQQNGIVVQVYSPLEQGCCPVLSHGIMFPAARGPTKSGSSGKICCA